MKTSFVAAALLAGLVGPASAATVLDFTANDFRSGSVGTVGWTVTGDPVAGDLRDAVHGNRNNCGPYACVSTTGGFDVGFGIRGGGNDNEIDPFEAVIVRFDEIVNITGFAGMLAYFARSAPENFESVRLEYKVGAGPWQLGGVADAVEPGTPFDTVGLAKSKKLWFRADAVRFTSGGQGTADDRSFNVTAAALTVAPVPVPASLPLLLAGIGALGWAARRKRKAA